MRDPGMEEAIAAATVNLNPQERAAVLAGIFRALYGATMPGSGSYQRTTRQEAPGEAFTEFRWNNAAGQYETRQAFEDRDWGDWADKVQQPGKTIDRNVLARARSLQRMIAGTGYEGERANAQAALDRLMRKHGFLERDL